ncbi:MAG: hypothetical protein NT105_10050 [Verrucomicrobia bacterium]|nr:hypothetical protein [Verrucomicrobiota bacterium]
MNRRSFIKTTATAGTSLLAGVTTTEISQAAVASAASRTPAILGVYSAGDHRRRLANIGLCERAIRKCMRKHLVTSYLPAQCCYNLGEYPCRTPWDPDDYDEQELDRLRDHGIQVIQVFDDWNDSLRLFGGDKYTPLNPAGFRRFVDMVHQRGMKLLPYVSTGFLQKTDPDYRPEWTRAGDVLTSGYWNMARCQPASPGWRAFLLPRILRIMDEWGADGIYDDCGYVHNARRLAAKQPLPPTQDEVQAFEETADYDGALTDLLALIHAEIKRRGGIFKVHISGPEQPRTGGLRVYDYLWVGEGGNNADKLREATKNHPPYVVPCLDLSRATIANEDELYLHAIPYLQFPMLAAGRPFTGERATIPGVSYPPEERCFYTRRCRAIWKQYQANPNPPHCYSWWDSFPGRPEARPTHARWLRQYLPMVEEGTWAWLEIGDSDLFAQPPPKDVVASAFANREFHLVLANYGQSAIEVATHDAYVPVAEAGAARKQWTLPARSLRILRRSAA